MVPTHINRHASYHFTAVLIKGIPAWAPFLFNNLKGSVIDLMQWERRGIGGE